MRNKNKYPNIILLVLDTVRADHLSCYGYHRKTTPFLEKLAAESTLYENCYSPSSWTLPSHASIFTGTYLSRHNVGDSGDMLDNSYQTMAGSLKEKGYDTFGSCYIPWVSSVTGLDKGFDYFNTKMNKNQLVQIVRNIKKLRHQTSDSEKNNSQKNEKLRDTRWIVSTTKSKSHWMKTLFKDDGAAYANSEARKWIRSRNGNPFFMFLNYCEAHTIYHPPLGYRKKFLDKSSKPFWTINQDHREFMYNGLRMTEEDFNILQSLYDSEIAYLDSKVKELHGFLKSENLLDNTIFIVTSDHGEQFGEKGFMGHARNLYDSLLKVPLIIKYPGEQFERGRKKNLVQTVDLLPTLLDVINGKTNRMKEQMQGNSLMSDSRGAREPELVISEYKKQPFSADCFNGYPDDLLAKYLYAARSVVYENMKYIWKSNGSEELYDITKDSSETTNLIQQKQKEAEILKKKLNYWLSGFKANDLTNETIADLKVDDTVVDRLKALGYW